MDRARFLVCFFFVPLLFFVRYESRLALFFGRFSVLGFSVFGFQFSVFSFRFRGSNESNGLLMTSRLELTDSSPLLKKEMGL